MIIHKEIIIYVFLSFHYLSNIIDLLLFFSLGTDILQIEGNVFIHTNFPSLN